MVDSQAWPQYLLLKKNMGVSVGFKWNLLEYIFQITSVSNVNNSFLWAWPLLILNEKEVINLLDAKVTIIWKLVNWFAQKINWLVSIGWQLWRLVSLEIKCQRQTYSVLNYEKIYKMYFFQISMSYKQCDSTVAKYVEVSTEQNFVTDNRFWGSAYWSRPKMVLDIVSGKFFCPLNSLIEQYVKEILNYLWKLYSYRSSFKIVN